MTMMLRDTLDRIETDLDRHDEAESGEGDATAKAKAKAMADRALRLRMKQLILAAHAAPDPEVLRDALACLSTSTGCADDYAMFVDITDELLDKGIVSASDVQELLDRAPVSRWM